MPRHAAFHLGLHCLLKYLFTGIRIKNVKKVTHLIEQFNEKSINASVKQDSYCLILCITVYYDTVLTINRQTGPTIPKDPD